jgi:hypothetical protein
LAKSSISALRTWIGSAPIKELVQRCCTPLLDPENHPRGFYAGLRLVALDGSCFKLADEASIFEAFGRLGSRTGFSALLPPTEY